MAYNTACTGRRGFAPPNWHFSLACRPGQVGDEVFLLPNIVHARPAAPLPSGANAVVKVEDTEFALFNTGAAAPQQVSVSRPVQPGQFVRFRGEDLPAGQKVRLRARLAEPIESDGRESYLQAIVGEEDGILMARLTSRQTSRNIFSLAQANALLIVSSGVKSLPAHSEVEIWLNA